MHAVMAVGVLHPSIGVATPRLQAEALVGAVVGEVSVRGVIEPGRGAGVESGRVAGILHASGIGVPPIGHVLVLQGAHGASGAGLSQKSSEHPVARHLTLSH